MQHSGNRRVASASGLHFAHVAQGSEAASERSPRVRAAVASCPLFLCSWRQSRSPPPLQAPKAQGRVLLEVLFGESRFAPLLTALGDLPSRWQEPRAPVL